MELLNKRHRVTKLAIGRLRDQINNLLKLKQLDIETVSKLEAMMADYRNLKEIFKKECDDILLTANEADETYTGMVNNLLKDLDLVNEFSFTCEGKIRAFYKQITSDEARNSLLPTGSNLNASFRSSENNTQPKLDKIAIPKFDGNILDFPNFKGLFENLIHKNSDLSNVQKLYYLKQALVGSAIALVRDFELQDSAYIEAWNHVLIRYDNKRAIVRAHFRKFHSLEPIKSDTQIRHLLDEIDVILRGLRAAGEVINDTFSRYIAYHVSICLDPVTVRDWENSISSTVSYPTFQELEKFLQLRCFAVEDRTIERHLIKLKKDSKESKPTERETLKIEKKSLNSSLNKIICVVCSDNHFLNQCKKFLSMSVIDRFDCVKKHKLCIKCFNPYHTVNNCKRADCSNCGKKHHSLLHRNILSSPTAITTPTDSLKPAVTSTVENQIVSKTSGSCLISNVTPKLVFLSTAVVKIRTFQRNILARVLLDNGSQATLVTKNFVNRAGITTFTSSQPTSLSGITDGISILEKSAQLILQSRYSNFQIAIEAELIDKIPHNIPESNISNLMNSMPNISFAECKLSHDSVDILLGSEYYEFVIDEHRYFIEDLVLRNTKFGYVMSGIHKSSYNVNKSYCGLSKIDINSQLRKFWEVEELTENETSKNIEIANECKLVEDFFNKTFKFNVNNRFVVRLPITSTINILNGSIIKAKQLLLNNERKLSPEAKRTYNNFMFEYEQLGHMRKLRVDELSLVKYYIPHHLVYKLSSTTTKARVVFNASANDQSNSSLNDHLMNGPILQPELFDTIIRFRNFRIAFCADIEKMFRQVLVDSDDRKYQCILWRPTPNEPIAHYEHNTITYGTKPAVYLATKCLEIIASQLETINKGAAQAARRLYVDDLLSGADTVEAALTHQRVIHETFAKYGFPLRKYQSNSSILLNNIDSTLVENLSDRIIGTESSIHVLGLSWSPKSDTLRVIINSKSIPKIVTKRVILSEISKIYDILGILSPVVIRGKILLQELWREDVKWDDPISENLKSNFLKYCEELNTLNNYNIPRLYNDLNNVKIQQLVGFCDSSLKAYCAIIYIRTLDNFNNVNVKFVCAKARVAPLKSLTIPRLELLSAVMLAKLSTRIAQNLNISIENVILFSDSNVVLSWLKCKVNQLKQFVSNRVKIIHENTNVNNWYYVSTNVNPADCATRGLTAANFKSNLLWSNGPQFLISDFDKFINSPVEIIKNIPELRAISLNSTIINLDSSILTRFSEYCKLINVISYMYRFINRQTKFSKIELSVEERTSAQNSVIRLSQHLSFFIDLERVANGKPPKKGSNLRYLDPFLDKNGILRVGGRLKRSSLTYDKRHPIILSTKCNLSRLLIRHIHVKYFHCSKSIILTYLQNNYWFVGGLSNSIKQVIRNCTFCIRLRAVTGQQLMGQLPPARVTISRPFSHVGIDFAGHFTVKCLGHRSVKYNKVYAAFFVCFCSRAVHIEIVSDLTTENFIESLHRFIARRGVPCHIYSDNGRNFVGASNLLFINRNKMLQWAVDKGIKWDFITPRSPHQGGLWEAAIKSGKSLLMRATNNQVLTFEQLSTIFCRIESILNSRPLCRGNKNQSEEIITPGHFLIGDSLLSMPIDEMDSSVNLGRKLELTRNIVQRFWREWSRSYLNELQRRNKWSTRVNNFKIGDIVLLKDSNMPPNQWPLAKIVDTYPDAEGLVRNVKILVSCPNRTFNRNINSLVPLLTSEDLKYPQPGEFVN